MYIDEITLRQIQPCTAAGNKIKIKAAFSITILDILPYINSSISSAVYNKDASWLTFRMNEKIVTLFSDSVTVTKLLNETDAYETLDSIKDMINEIDKKRTTIVPSNDMKKRPTPLDIYKNLPKTNCNDCGEATCMAFAGKVLTGQKDFQTCIHLLSSENADKQMELENMIAMFGINKI